MSSTQPRTSTALHGDTSANSRDASATLAVERARVDDSVLVARGLGIAGLVAVAVVHLVQLPETVPPTPGLGALFTALVLAAVLVAAGLVRADVRALWYATALTATGPLLGYVLTRSMPVPFDTEDVGNWTEPLGLVALLLEGCLLALSVYRLVALAPAGRAVRRRRKPTDASAPNDSPCSGIAFRVPGA
jgi:hypothetical protein